MPRGPLAIFTRGRFGPFLGRRRLLFCFGTGVGVERVGAGRTWPPLAATPQSAVEGQETPKKWLAEVPPAPGNGSTLVKVQAPGPPVGWSR